MDEMESLKAELLRLQQQKSVIEAELAERMGRLNAPAGAGLSGNFNLVDKEGFPRADIDIPQIKEDRHRVAVCRTDHRALLLQIELLLHKLHLAARTAKQQGEAERPAASSEAAGRPTDNTDSSRAQPLLRPFAIIDEVAPESPAAAAGIRVGDRLCRFGDVVHAGGAGAELPAVAATLQRSEGAEVPTVVLRGGAHVELALRPQTWAGRGLLGCHLKPE